MSGLGLSAASGTLLGQGHSCSEANHRDFFCSVGNGEDYAQTKPLDAHLSER